METQIVQMIPAELEQAIERANIGADGAASLAAGFAPHFIAYRELAERAQAVAPDAPKAARSLRLEIKAVRVAAEATRKSLKEDSLRRGKAIDGVNNLLLYQLTPVEEAMEAIEKAEEIREHARRKALADARAADLSPFADPQFLDLGSMPQAQYDALLAGAKSAHEAKIAAARAEAERAELERQEAIAERARLQAENVRLAAEKAEADRLAAVAKAEADARESALRAEAQRKQREVDEAARLERQRVEAAAAKAKAEADAREAAAREEARKAQVEADRLAAEAKARAEEQHAREVAEAEARRNAAAAPDKQKLVAFAAALRSLPVPQLATSGALTDQLLEQVEKFAMWVERKAAEL